MNLEFTFFIFAAMGAAVGYAVVDLIKAVVNGNKKLREFPPSHSEFSDKYKRYAGAILSDLWFEHSGQIREHFREWLITIMKERDAEMLDVITKERQPKIKKSSFDDVFPFPKEMADRLQEEARREFSEEPRNQSDGGFFPTNADYEEAKKIYAESLGRSEEDDKKVLLSGGIPEEVANMIWQGRKAAVEGIRVLIAKEENILNDRFTSLSEFANHYREVFDVDVITLDHIMQNMELGDCDCGSCAEAREEGLSVVQIWAKANFGDLVDTPGIRTFVNLLNCKYEFDKGGDLEKAFIQMNEATGMEIEEILTYIKDECILSFHEEEFENAMNYAKAKAAGTNRRTFFRHINVMGNEVGPLTEITPEGEIQFDLDELFDTLPREEEAEEEEINGLTFKDWFSQFFLYARSTMDYSGPLLEQAWFSNWKSGETPVQAAEEMIPILVEAAKVVADSVEEETEAVLPEEQNPWSEPVATETNLPFNIEFQEVDPDTMPKVGLTEQTIQDFGKVLDAFAEQNPEVVEEMEAAKEGSVEEEVILAEDLKSEETEEKPKAKRTYKRKKKSSK